MDVRNERVPEGEVEAVLAEVWCESLKIAQIGRDDNFFELGGHSALAMMVFEKVAERLSVQLPLIAIFRCPTVREMADLVTKSRAAGPDSLELEDGIL